MTRAPGILGAILLAALVLVAPAPVARADEAADAFRRGDFIEAERAGRARADVEGLTIAAAALMARGRFIDTGRAAREDLEAARTLAERAVSLDPGAVEARLVAAVALGALSRDMDAVEAYFTGTAREGRREIDAVLSLAPDHARALALSGEWHLEVVRRAGPRLARMLYDAGLEAGIADFEAALARAPDDPVIRVEFALALLGVDEEGLAPRAARELRAARSMAARDAFERLTLDQGLAALDRPPLSAITEP